MTECSFMLPDDTRCDRPRDQQSKRHCSLHANGRDLPRNQPKLKRDIELAVEECARGERALDLRGVGPEGLYLGRLKIANRTLQSAVLVSSCDLTSIEAIGVSFQGGLFADEATIGDLHLSGCTFTTLDLRGARVGRIAAFDRCQFQDHVRFSRAQFDDHLFLCRSEFFAEATFDSCAVGKEAAISNAPPPDKFCSDLPEDLAPRRAHFHCGASFTESHFNKLRVFDVLLSGELSLSRSTIASLVLDQIHNPVGPIELDLRDLRRSGDDPRSGTLSDDTFISIRRCNLSRVMFQGTDMRRVALENVTWGSRKGAEALWDEYRSRNDDGQIDEECLRWMAATYRVLVLRYDASREFGLSESFHVGELEVLRQAKGLEFRKRLGLLGRVAPAIFEMIGRTVNAYSLYRFLSFYGTSYWRAIGNLALLALLLPLPLMLTGLEPIGDNNAAPIRYRLCNPLTCDVVPTALVADYSETLTHTLKVLTLQRDRRYAALGFWSTFVIGSGSLAGIGIASLALLAVRRRFRRS